MSPGTARALPGGGSQAGDMKAATQTNAELAATRRPKQGSAAIRRLRGHEGINIAFVYAVLLLVCIVWTFVAPEQLRFATEGNFSVLAQQIPVTAVAAIGVGILMIAGEFDISIAGTFTLIPFGVAIVLGDYQWPIALACLVGLAMAIVIGAVNGFVTIRLGIPSFIATLGTAFVLRGIVRFVSINPKTNQPDSIAFFPGDTFKAIFTGHIVGPIYAQVVWLIIVAFIGYLLLNRHQLGNHFFAAGGNRNAAQAVGVPVARVKYIAFIICAITAGFAGLLQATRISEIEPSFATLSGFELKAIAAVVVGGVSLFGGRGAILGMVLGAALLDTVDNILVLTSAPETYFKGFLGAIIIVAVILNTWLRRRGRQ